MVVYWHQATMKWVHMSLPMSEASNRRHCGRLAPRRVQTAASWLAQRKNLRPKKQILPSWIEVYQFGFC